MSFVDTNVLVHATDTSSPDNARAQKALMALIAAGPVAISRQILREYVCVVTRGQQWSAPLPLPDAMITTDSFLARFKVLEDGPEVWDRLRMLSGAYGFAGKQVHDANIVATMLAHGEDHILTFNGKDFRRFAPKIKVIEP